MRRQNWERTAVPEPAERATVAQILWLRLRMRRIGLTARQNYDASHYSQWQEPSHQIVWPFAKMKPKPRVSESFSGNPPADNKASDCRRQGRECSEHQDGEMWDSFKSVGYLPTGPCQSERDQQIRENTLFLIVRGRPP